MPADSQFNESEQHFGEVVSYSSVTDAQGVALLGVTAAARESEEWTTVSDIPETGWHGVAWTGHFRSGFLHRITLRLAGINRKEFRFELHGSVARYQRCFCDIDLSTHTVQPAEEMMNAELYVLENGCELICTFIPQSSTTQWLYLLSRADQAVHVSPCEGAAFRVGKFELAVAHHRAPGFRPLRHNPATEFPDNVVFALQTYILLRNYFHLQFEIAAAGKHPVQIDIKAGRRIAHAAWISPDTYPRSDMITELHWSRGPTGDTETLRLYPSRGPRPLPSPALSERFGSEYSWQGQAIWGLFADWTDTDFEIAETSQAAVELKMDITFSDNSTTCINLDRETLQKLTLPAQPTVVDMMWREISTISTGRFLEVGGRGSVAAINRQRLASQWTYFGFDVLTGPNVDVVGDAHELSSYFEPQTFDVLFADQVLEHLLMPWKFIVEANRVLKVGGLLCLSTPSALPLHAEPWDFYRFSDHSWVGMLNSTTGFEILDRGINWPVLILSRVAVPGLERMPYDPAFMMTSVLARKTSEVSVDWPGYHSRLAYGLYPRDR